MLILKQVLAHVIHNKNTCVYHIAIAAIIMLMYKYFPNANSQKLTHQPNHRFVIQVSGPTEVSKFLKDLHMEFIPKYKTVNHLTKCAKLEQGLAHEIHHINTCANHITLAAIRILTYKYFPNGNSTKTDTSTKPQVSVKQVSGPTEFRQFLMDLCMEFITKIS